MTEITSCDSEIGMISVSCDISEEIYGLKEHVHFNTCKVMLVLRVVLPATKRVKLSNETAFASFFSKKNSSLDNKIRIHQLC